ncbi:MAG: type II toxin-antitoxin system death-on-curing family toxin [Acetobacteraceae bacterium]
MTDPVWIEEREALVFHERLLVLHGGAAGIRDKGLLSSALTRPRQHVSYGHARQIAELAALYTAGIVKNHPFIDGNKRTGFLLGVLFLELNGFAFTASQEDAANAVIALAAGKMNEQDYAIFLKANAAPVAP